MDACRQGRIMQGPALSHRMLRRLAKAVRGYEHNGASRIACMLTDRGRSADTARQPAHRLYSICDPRRAGWPLADNALVQGRSGITRHPRESCTGRAEQTAVFQGDQR